MLFIIFKFVFDWYRKCYVLACVGGSTLVGQRPVKLLLSVHPSVRPSVTKFFQDWIISFF